MTDTHLIVVRSGLPMPVAAPGELVVSDDEVRAWVLDGRILGRVQRYRVGRLVTERLSTSGRPMLLWALRLMAGRCSIVDGEGLERDVSIALLARWSWQLARDAALQHRLLRRVEREVDALAAAAHVRTTTKWDRSAPVLYLRTDLSFGVRAGGSVGHSAGVLNELPRITGGAVLLTTTDIPTLAPDVEVHHVPVPERFWNFRELPALALNDVVGAEALRALNGRCAAFIYQRYSLNNYAGLRLARRLGVPFVLEYNGSEIWMGRHWGRPLKHESLGGKIELLNVNGADLVVVVSRAMRDELTARGASASHILVNPNAVDPERYNPNVDGHAVRAQYDLIGKIVIGFIATFQPWHGAELLAQAFVRMLRDDPADRDSVRLLLIGTGPRLAATKAIISAAGLDDVVACTDLVRQEDGPRYLAASDVLVSPHVPNPDGSPFFGSPTKLFEYMAMGKGIVASSLDQIGEVLRHGETAWMVPPDDAPALAVGLARLVHDRALRAALGDNARREVLAHHTWRAHVQKTIDALESRNRANVA